MTNNESVPASRTDEHAKYNYRIGADRQRRESDIISLCIDFLAIHCHRTIASFHKTVSHYTVSLLERQHLCCVRMHLCGFDEKHSLLFAHLHLINVRTITILTCIIATHNDNDNHIINTIKISKNRILFLNMFFLIIVKRNSRCIFLVPRRSNTSQCSQSLMPNASNIKFIFKSLNYIF